jgi:hypothetical protein
MTRGKVTNDNDKDDTNKKSNNDENDYKNIKTNNNRTMTTMTKN